MKKLTAVLLAVSLILLIAGCGKKEPALPPSSSPSSGQNDSSLPSKDNPSSSSPSDISSGQVSRPESRPDGDKQETIPAPENTPHEGHYAYEFLTNVQKVYYEAMHTAVEEMHPSWIVLGPRTDSYATDIAVVRSALVADHPEIFWLPHYYVTATGTDGEGNPTALMMFSSSFELSPAYLVTRSEKSYMEKELKSAVDEISALVTATDPFEIELQLHDILCSRVEYSNDSADSMIYTAYGALVNGKALCEGYSRAMQLLLSQFGILSTTVSGIAENEGHMWNLVNIEGGWYNLDVTWNDSSKDFISHEYFNITDSEISLDHTFSADYTELSAEDISLGKVSFNISRPKAQNTDADYFAKRGFILTAEKLPELVLLLISAPEKVIEVKYASSAVKEDFNNNMTAYIEELNGEIALSSEADFYIGRIASSSLTLKLYKEQKEDTASARI